ncbi:AI-2E family transporter [Variovorax paradoxus]|nr:AI-2E family transporter [Variovorax paradoxus]
MTRARTSALALMVATAIALYLCWKMTQPFVPALAWALTLAILGYGVHRRLARRLRRPSLSAGLVTAVLSVLIVVPVAALSPIVVSSAAEGWDSLRSESVRSRVDKAVRSNPSLGPAVRWVSRQAPSTEEMAKHLAPRVPGILTGSLWAGVEVLVTFFALFYLLRDRDKVLVYLRSVLPLTTSETTRVFKRVSEVVRASVLGTLLVAAIQGLLGGLMFWWLDIPAPLLWGAVMFLLSVLPILGAAIVWIPAAVFLVTEGSWEKALILSAWGSVVVALIDNLLYPILVGDRLRLHTLPVFIAIVGGLVAFGSSGFVIGPLVFAVTMAVVDIWRDRTAAGRAADSTPPGT